MHVSMSLRSVYLRKSYGSTPSRQTPGSWRLRQRSCPVPGDTQKEKRKNKTAFHLDLMLPSSCAVNGSLDCNADGGAHNPRGAHLDGGHALCRIRSGVPSLFKISKTCSRIAV